MKKQALAIITATLLGMGAVYGASTAEDTIDVVAYSPISNEIELVPGSYDISDLGTNAVDLTTIGYAAIDSNDGTGFYLNITSAQDGYLVLVDDSGTIISSPEDTQKIAYVLQVAEQNSNLGSGLTASGLDTDLTLSQSTETTLSFVGSATETTSGYNLDLKVKTSAKADLMGGNYEDTITIEIADVN